MSIEITVYKVTGISSVLMHNPASMVRPTGDITKKTIPSAEDEAEAATYRLPNGQLFLKSIAFRSALLAGCRGKRLGKLGAASQVAAGVFPVEIECPLYHPTTGKPIHEYVINTTRAVVQKNGVMRSRPEIREWACDVAFEVETDFVTVNQVLELFNLGGRVAGVGDWRPEKKGPYGRFNVELKTKKK